VIDILTPFVAKIATLSASPHEGEGKLIDGQWESYDWNRYEGLRCVICQWDTLRGLNTAREHAANCERCHPKSAASGVWVADKSGREKTS